MLCWRGESLRKEWVILINWKLKIRSNWKKKKISMKECPVIWLVLIGIRSLISFCWEMGRFLGRLPIFSWLIMCFSWNLTMKLGNLSWINWCSLWLNKISIMHLVRSIGKSFINYFQEFKSKEYFAQTQETEK